jgi:hypothetical protein
VKRERPLGLNKNSTRDKCNRYPSNKHPHSCCRRPDENQTPERHNAQLTAETALFANINKRRTSLLARMVIVTSAVSGTAHHHVDGNPRAAVLAIPNLRYFFFALMHESLTWWK